MTVKTHIAHAVTITSLRIPSDDLPAFNEWNRGTLPNTRNCYAFVYNAYEPDTSQLALGQYQILIALPGYMGGNPCQSMTAEALCSSLQADGLIAIPDTEENNIKPLDGHYLVSAFVDPQRNNCHFYRRHEESGLWYHKAGWYGPVTHNDKTGRIITNGRQDGGIRSFDFAGYFWVPQKGLPLDIRVQPAEPNIPHRTPALTGNNVSHAAL
ncbi:MAG: hypothetical protein SFW62_03870 [Alphaproteobacteria bacterium]|nr:hypothetical protein [Alphaproteobacteria bacterium]